jgi:ubiquinone/menaquinone biosynthesis C-methylase UbiE
MDSREAVALIESAVRGRGGTWADIGAGRGTFTRALVELLGTDSRIYAVDRDATALNELLQWARRSAPNVSTVTADFAEPFELPGVDAGTLDGLLLANALHFVPDAEAVLARLVWMLRPGGRVVLVEYDRRDASQWVPYPISRARLPSLAKAAGLSAPTVFATHPSMYSGLIYAATMDRGVTSAA